MKKTNETCGPTHYAGCDCHEEGWENKWKSAIGLGARYAVQRDRYENALSEIAEIVSETIGEQSQESTYEQLESAVIAWAKDRQIIQNGSSTSQLLKAIAEMGELADAHNKNDREGVIDGLGDVLVCLINYAEIEELSLVGCLESAYEEIKDRKGRLMPNGVFVKEE